MIAIVIVIIVMYNFSKYMQNRNKIDEEIIYDDVYPEEYVYYGFTFDEDGNYQLMGLTDDFTEELLGLRSFYPMNRMYYYNEHLVLYTDAINQINYNKNDNEYFFYEQNSFYSNNTDVLITPDYYVFYDGEKLEYCSIANCTNTLIAEELASDVILTSNNLIYYVHSDAIYEYDLATATSKAVMYPDANNEMQLLAANEEYLVLLNGFSIYAYEIDTATTTNISDIIISEDLEFSFLTIQGSNLLYQVKDTSGNNIIKSYSLLIKDILNSTYNIANEEITNCFIINDTLMYAELVNGDNVRYVIMDMEEKKVVKEFDKPYIVLIGVD